MARNILLRFNENEELIKLIDKTSKKLGVTNSSLTRFALFEYCKLILGQKNAKSTN